MPSGGKRYRIPDHEIIARAKRIGIEARPRADGWWVVNGVAVARRSVLAAIGRGERGHDKPFGWMDVEATDGVPLNEMWSMARQLNTTLILHPNGMVTLGVNNPREPGQVYDALRTRHQTGAGSYERHGDWALAQRAQGVFGRNVVKRGRYWFVDGGGSYTTERLEAVVAAVEAKEKAA